ncbi:MAG: dTDP-4-dehydrorhamnose reductase [Bacillota bacterium]
MKVMVTGAAGVLGRAVAAECEGRGWNVLALNRQQLDVTHVAAVREAVHTYRPRVLINCAAYVDVDGAEAHVEQAFAVNALAPRNLARLCKEEGVLLVHIGTDYIFSGEKDEPYRVYDLPGPLNRYGASKWWGEQAVREVGGEFLIVRTSWLFGPGGRHFVGTILKAAETGTELRVVDDQQGCPSYAPDVARALADLVAADARGTFHVTNGGITTWYRLAEKVLELAEKKVRVVPCGTEAYPRPARRPRFSALDPFPLKETIGYLLPPWEDALRRYLEGRQGER